MIYAIIPQIFKEGSYMDFVAISVFTHALTIFFLLGVMVANYFSVANMTKFVPLALTLRKRTPFYHFLNATMAYTGMIVAAYTKDLSFTIILMSITTILLMILEIKRYKKMRIITSKDTKRQDEFIIYAKKIYTIEILVVIAVYIISKIF
jgi:hypothetical protein